MKSQIIGGGKTLIIKNIDIDGPEKGIIGSTHSHSKRKSAKSASILSIIGNKILDGFSSIGNIFKQKQEYSEDLECCSEPCHFCVEGKCAQIEDDDNNNDNDNNKENLSEKEKLMKIISTQDVIEGSWEENKETKVIKEKYLKEYELLTGLKDKNISEKVALTIIIILLIEKEHKELIGELILIIKKAKNILKKKRK